MAEKKAGVVTGKMVSEDVPEVGDYSDLIKDPELDKAEKRVIEAALDFHDLFDKKVGRQNPVILLRNEHYSVVLLSREVPRECAPVVVDWLARMPTKESIKLAKMVSKAYILNQGKGIGEA